MEVMRILKAAGLKPRRTIRIGLWSGEEQGLLGSRAYVAEHFALRPTAPEDMDRDSEEYRKLMQAHIQALTTRFSESRIDYVPLNTPKPLDDALFSYLGNRERLMRVR